MLCACGCQKEVKVGKSYVCGHSNKGRKFSEGTLRKMSESQRGRVFSDEHRRRISEAKKGKKRSVETRRRMSEAMKGKKFSDEHRQKIGEAKKGKKRKKFSVEHRRRMSESFRGRVVSVEHRRRISEANKGKRHSDETRRKMSVSRKGRNAGSKSYQWKGGDSIAYGSDWPVIRLIILTRDQFTCQRCRVLDHKAHVHHMIPYRLTKSNDPSNLISLCKKCHEFVEAMFEREFKKSGFDMREFRTFWMYVYRNLLAEQESRGERMPSDYGQKAIPDWVVEAPIQVFPAVYRNDVEIMISQPEFPHSSKIR